MLKRDIFSIVDFKYGSHDHYTPYPTPATGGVIFSLRNLLKIIHTFSPFWVNFARFSLFKELLGKVLYYSRPPNF
ncbi:hypothetical protein KUTeg_022449 [Tegillarca granosa]|uniref:Uncharacterized protein n=1 Tax=Tegillarca granosa TaxID=220873 RepID=A0ABQ9EBV0_TEGGR|nr:hypothetical protein KUTeg_022449 [Tegillarca granosa]